MFGSVLIGNNESLFLHLCANSFEENQSLTKKTFKNVGAVY